MDEIEKRARFEVWLPDLLPMDSFVDIDGCIVYVDRFVQGAWLGWQAALSAAPQGVPDDVRRDADRYRWLRQFDVDSYLAGGSMDRLDASIDSSMLAAKPEPQA